MPTLRFVTCSDLISRIIRSGEMGFPFSHTEALVDGTLLGAHADGGVQARALDYDKGQWSEEIYVTVPATPNQEAVFENFLRSQIGKPYDMEAIGEMALGVVSGEAPDWTQSPSWICSALQMGALLSAGLVKAAPATVRLSTPRDVLVACAALTPIGQPTKP
jgi:hypothetical protein